MKKVMLDPGHGGKDPGAITKGLQEKEIVLKIGLFAEKFLLDNYLVEVKMTRKTDIFLSLNERTNLANKFYADLFVSIHVNSGEKGTGFESFIYLKTPEETYEFQKVLHSEMQNFYKLFNLRDRGMKRADLYVLKHTKMSAILTENLFIQRDESLLRNDVFLKSVGEAHAKGIAKVLKLKKNDK